ncbi:MAG: DUF3500 domain-containing protein [Myxococcota bacterium]|nr:DUF3500 domain-containing protein [Myxococcota bacterium]
MEDRKITRRRFLQASGAVGAGALASGAWPGLARAATAATPESLVAELHGTLSEEQRAVICFPWNHVDPRRGLLRTHVSNNWQITEPALTSAFYTPDQRALVRAIFEGMIAPEWHERFDKQQRDDSRGPFGDHLTIALFGDPGDGPFELVFAGRHMTLRCDGDSAEHVAFGGPIFYGHACNTRWWSGGLIEQADHEGNVFWPQALAANGLYAMMDGRQRALALERDRPDEDTLSFRDPRAFDGIPISELSRDQREEAQRILRVLLEPFRTSDREEVVRALDAQGGLDACSISFYEEWDLGRDQIWDHFRVEGPGLVWNFRAFPHVHVWVHASADSSVPANVGLF